MRNLNLEAGIWYLFTAPDFFEAAAQECEGIAVLYEGNPEMFDKFARRAREFRKGAALAHLDSYQFISNIAEGIRSDVRGIIEQVGWMNLDEFKDFSGGRFERLTMYANRIESALYNALIGASSFFHPDPDCPERSNDDDGYPGDKIVSWFEDYVGHFEGSIPCTLPDPLPHYWIDISTTCQIGEEVPWTGVWFPGTGLERHSLTFAIKGMRMQPVYRVVKTTEELSTKESMFPSPETIAVATTWYRLIPAIAKAESAWQIRNTVSSQSRYSRDGAPHTARAPYTRIASILKKQETR